MTDENIGRTYFLGTSIVKLPLVKNSAKMYIINFKSIQYKLEYGILLGRRQKYSIFEFPFYEVKLGLQTI